MKKLWCILSLLLALVCVFAACDTETPNGDTNTPNTEQNGGGGDNQPSHTHAFGEWSVSKVATCVAKGEEKRTCACGESETRDVAKLEHTYGNWSVSKTATCVAKGEEKRTCTCGASEIREIAATGEHVYLNWTERTPATCAEAGEEFGACSCGATDTREIPATGEHFYNEQNVCTGCNTPLQYTEGLQYELNADETAYIVTGIGAAVTDPLIIIIPNYHQGLPVTSIGAEAFSGCTSLRYIRIPESVTSIGYDAFSNCTSLQGKVHNNGKYLGNNTNPYLVLLGVVNKIATTFAIPNTTKIIGSRAFYQCSITSITIPEGVTSIGNNAFLDCESLTSINIPSSVNSICYKAFQNCDNLDAVYITDLAAWCNMDFMSGDDEETNPLYHAKNLYLNDELITTLIIPDGVTNIKKWVFWGCSATRVIIPSSVQSIGEYAFYDCNFESALLHENSQLTFIDQFAFFGCSTLTSITIPVGVTSIGRYAFEGCSHLTSVVFEENSQLRSIGSSAFADCTSLTSITIPEGVTSIGDDAFYNCMGIIQKENGVSYVDKWAIDCDDSVTSVTLRNDTVGIASYAFEDCTSLISITIPSSMTSIVAGMFSGCSKLTSITIPEGVTSIGDYAFYYCTSLASITIPEGVTSIGNDTFRNCSSLASITLPSRVTNIGSSAFKDCTSLTSITIPEGVTSIGAYAFAGHYARPMALTSVTFEEGSQLTSIGYGAFQYCESLTSITIPEGVTSIDAYAFAGDHRCPMALTSVTFEEGSQLTSIGYGAFQYCESLTSIAIPLGVTAIDHRAFFWSRLQTVYYSGTEGDWKDVSIGSDNIDLTTATRYYYSAKEPTTAGNYWHYDNDGKPVAW